MRCKVLIPSEITIKPGDFAVIDIDRFERLHKKVLIVRIVESIAGNYVVFDNHTWRPINTHGVTWLKLD